MPYKHKQYTNISQIQNIFCVFQITLFRIFQKDILKYYINILSYFLYLHI